MLALAAVLVAVALAVVLKKRQKRQCAQRQQRVQDICSQIPETESIFVSIASYRDPECPHTLQSLFRTAACPLRVFVGICDQSYAHDIDPLDRYLRMARNEEYTYKDNIRVYRMDASEARGPMLARHMIQRYLYRQEKYYLQIDSHTLFTPNWDLELVRELNACFSVSEKPVLTTYPDDYSHRSRYKGSQASRPPGSYLRFKKINDQWKLPELEAPKFRHVPLSPMPSLFWAAGFSFSLGSVVRDVPYDCYCDYVFFGEEIQMCARMWTHGYDFFHPTRMYVFHMWSRDYRPTFWEQLQDDQERKALQKRGYARLKAVFGSTASPEANMTEIATYGLGTVRSLQAYEAYCGVDLRNVGLAHAHSHATQRAKMGLSPNASSEELMAKHGIMHL